MDINPLICSASPRDIEIVKRELDKIPQDKIIAKYYREGTALRILRDYFLRHKEYTHMVMAPDDLVITKSGFDKLLEDVDKYRFAYLGGLCNLRWGDLRYAVGMFYDGMTINYGWLNKTGVKEQVKEQGWHIIQVGFNGWICGFIERSIVEKVPFRGWDGIESAYDSAFTEDCYHRGIPIHTETDVCFRHLKWGPLITEEVGRHTIGFDNPDCHVVFEGKNGGSYKWIEEYTPMPLP